MIDLLPNNIEAERAILGGILSDNQAIFSVIDFLNPTDFYNRPNQVLYSIMREMANSNRTIDYVTLGEEIKRLQVEEELGGLGYLALLDPVEYSGRHVEHWGIIVKQKSKLRQQIIIGQRMIEAASSPEANPDEIIEEVETSLVTVSEKKSSSLQSAPEAIKKHLDYLDLLFSTEHHVTGIETGLTRLDSMTDGLQRGEVTTVAARPGHGKTAFGTTLMTRVPEVKTLFISAEQTTRQILNRMVARMAKVDGFLLRTGNLDYSSRGSVYLELKRMLNNQFWIDDSGTMTLNRIRATAKKIRVTKGLDLLIVDYLGLIQHTLPRNQQHKRNEVVSAVSHGLKALAKDLNIAIVSLAQLNRDIPEYQEPELHNLAESGDIERDSDVVLFLWTKMVKPQQAGQTGELHDMITVAKQRNGATGRIRVLFKREYTSYENLETYRTEEELV